MHFTRKKGIAIFGALLALLLGMAMFLAACGTDKPEATVTLDKPAVTLDLYETVTLTAQTTNTDDSVTWSSSDESVATVTDGVVAALAEGTATITASAGGKTAACEVTVAPSGAVPLLELNMSSSTFKKGGSVTIEPKLTYKGAELTGAVFTFESSDPEKVPVSADGVVNGAEVGSAVITVEASYLNFVTGKTVEVTVTDDVTISVSTQSVRLAASDPKDEGLKTSETITVAIEDNGETVDAGTALVWQSGDTDVATVSGGVITAVGEGETEVTAIYTSKAGIDYTVKVAVAVYVPVFDLVGEVPAVDLNADATEYAALDLSDAEIEAASVVAVKDVTDSSSPTDVNFTKGNDSLSLKKADLQTGERTLRLYLSNVAYETDVTLATKIIRTSKDLTGIGAYLESVDGTEYGGYFVLGNNIDMGGAEIDSLVSVGTVNGTTVEFAKTFSGVFDGAGYAISDFSINTAYGSLFGKVDGGTIRNVAFIDADITGNVPAAIIAYWFGSGSVMHDVFVKGSIAGGRPNDNDTDWNSLAIGHADAGVSVSNVFGVLDSCSGTIGVGGVVIADMVANDYFTGKLTVSNVYSINVTGPSGWLDYAATSVTPPAGSFPALGNNYGGRDCNYLHAKDESARRFTDSHLLKILRDQYLAGTADIRHADTIGEAVTQNNVRSFQNYTDFRTWIQRGNSLSGFTAEVWSDTVIPTFANAPAVDGNTVSITNTETEVIRGDSLQMEATADYVVWSLKESVAGVTITPEGLVEVSPDLSAATAVTVVCESLYGARAEYTLQVSLREAVDLGDDVQAEWILSGDEPLSVTITHDSAEPLDTVTSLTVGGIEINSFKQEGNTLTLESSAKESIADLFGEQEVVVATAGYEYTLTVRLITAVLTLSSDLTNLSERLIVLDDGSVGGYFVLGNNIDMDGAEISSLVNVGTLNGTGSSATVKFAKAFSGVFDGAGYTVSNFSINTAYGSLFGQLNGTVRNVAFIDANITGNVPAAVVAYRLGATGVVQNVFVKGSIAGGKPNHDSTDLNSLVVGFADKGATVNSVFGVLDSWSGTITRGGIIVGSVGYDDYLKGAYNFSELYSINVNGPTDWLDYAAEEMTPPTGANSSWPAVGNNRGDRDCVNYFHTKDKSVRRFTDSHLIAILYERYKSGEAINGGQNITEKVMTNNVRSFQNYADYATWIQRGNTPAGFTADIWSNTAIPTFDSAPVGGLTKVTNSSTTVFRGGSLQMTADVGYVLWSLQEPANGVTITPAGLVEVSAEATASSVTVVASSLFGDESVTAVITIEDGAVAAADGIAAE